MRWRCRAAWWPRGSPPAAVRPESDAWSGCRPRGGRSAGRWGGGGAGGARSPVGLGGAAFLLAGLALVALAVRAVPDLGSPHGLLTICVAATLTGLLGAAVAGSAVGRIGSLLLIGDALILAACSLPGTDALALCTILLAQAALRCALVRTRPALS